jgi:hypothetical protein
MTARPRRDALAAAANGTRPTHAALPRLYDLRPDWQPTGVTLGSLLLAAHGTGT